MTSLGRSTLETLDSGVAAILNSVDTEIVPIREMEEGIFKTAAAKTRQWHCDGCERVQGCMRQWALPFIYSVKENLNMETAKPGYLRQIRDCFNSSSGSKESTQACVSIAEKGIRSERNAVSDLQNHLGQIDGADRCVANLPALIRECDNSGNCRSYPDPAGVRVKADFIEHMKAEKGAQAKILVLLEPSWCWRHACDAQVPFDDIEKLLSEMRYIQEGIDLNGDILGAHPRGKALAQSMTRILLILEEAEWMLTDPQGEESLTFFNGYAKFQEGVQALNGFQSQWERALSGSCAE